ncbi:MAG: helix-turn-helix transcriptional regulator [Taibaiella sp.]
MSVGNNIKKIRLLRNYTQKYMAQILSMSHANYGKMENGIIGISQERIEKIAGILGVTMEEITDYPLSIIQSL